MDGVLSIIHVLINASRISCERAKAKAKAKAIKLRAQRVVVGINVFICLLGICNSVRITEEC